MRLGPGSTISIAKSVLNEYCNNAFYANGTDSQICRDSYDKTLVFNLDVNDKVPTTFDPETITYTSLLTGSATRTYYNRVQIQETVKATFNFKYKIYSTGVGNYFIDTNTVEIIPSKIQVTGIYGVRDYRTILDYGNYRYRCDYSLNYVICDERYLCGYETTNTTGTSIVRQ